MLKLEGIETYYGRIKVLQGISIHVPEGDIVAVLGSNGAGKSTILKAISGFIICDYGHIEFMGKRIENMDTHKIVRMGISQVPEGRHTFDDLTVDENLKTGAAPLKYKHNIKKKIEDLYDFFPKLGHLRRQKAKYLSGGERQMVAIGRALMADPKLLLLDEPSLGLSPLLVKEVFGKIKQINVQGITIVMVEQNVMLALGIAQMGYVIQNGRVERYGTSKKLLADDEIRSAYLGEGKYVDRKELWEGRIRVKK
ncbi:MAG: ABC transporter ATP-binding protein [Deltaproteobacteria bacterium]|nr:ABC transporter ATP-binding protein [Deltaproteobacteria bacterium]